jgi:ubiquinone/menaquinone biosynthesis C-methylase UbiE
MLPHWLIKLGFHLLYYEMAWSYDWVAWSVSFGQWSAWRRLALQFLQPGPILELAYGTGGLFLDMIEAGYQPVGIDFSPYMARLARRRLQHNQSAIGLNQAKAQALPFPSNHFANVIATFPTSYIFEPETLAEVYRVLKTPQPGQSSTPGRFIIVVEGQLRGPWPIRPLINWLYSATGQKNFPAAKPLPVFAKHNLSARWETVDYQGVSARLLIADKLRNRD